MRILQGSYLILTILGRLSVKVCGSRLSEIQVIDDKVELSYYTLSSHTILQLNFHIAYKSFLSLSFYNYHS